MYPNFSDEEWNRIIEDAFSPDAPEPPFSECYRERRLAMEKEFVMEKKRSVRKSTIKILAIAAAAAVITPTAVLAGVRLYEARMEKTNTYQRTVTINPGDEVSEEIMSYQIGWMPEDMIYEDDGKSDCSYRAEDDSIFRCVTFTFMKIPEGAQYNVSELGVTDEDAFTTASGNQAFYTATKQNGTDRGDLWIAFNDTPYMAYMMLCSVSTSEMRRIADNITLVPSDTETAHEWTPPEKDAMAEIAEKNLTHDYNAISPIADYSTMYPFAIGETVDCANEAFWFRTYTLRVNNVTVQDNFDGITTDCVGMEHDYSQYLDENGKITTIRQHIRRGNDVTTMDEVVWEETVQQYVLKVNMTFTNTSEESKYINLAEYVFWLNDNDMMDFGKDTDGLTIGHVTTGHLIGGEFSFDTAHETDKNNIMNVAPGESVDVDCYYLVDEDWFGNLHIAFGWTFVVGGDTDLPVLDLSGIRPE